MIVHGEINAIIFAHRDLSGCKLYTHPFLPCSRCAAVVIQSGITECHAPISDNPRWQESLALTRKLFSEAGVKFIEYEIF